MEKWYQKLRRGDVWFVSLNRETGDNIIGSSVERKSRPYLIISCEENNRNAPVVNAIPITTRNSDDYPMHVYYRYENGSDSRNQVILCEQITTLSAVLFEKPQTHFMYALLPTLMEKVDIALSSQLELNRTPVDMKQVEELINQMAQQKLEELQKIAKENAETQLSDIMKSIEQKFKVEVETPPKAQPMLKLTEKGLERKNQQSLTPPPTVRGTTHESNLGKTVAALDKEDILPDSKSIDEKGSRKIKIEPVRRKGESWTAELMRAYLEDFEHTSTADMSAKYSIAKKSVAQTAYQIKNKLVERPESKNET